MKQTSKIDAETLKNGVGNQGVIFVRLAEWELESGFDRGSKNQGGENQSLKS